MIKYEWNPAFKGEILQTSGVAMAFTSSTQTHDPWRTSLKIGFVKCIVAITVFVFLQTSALGADSRPNIVLLMSDDQGFVDVGYNANEEPVAQTPHLDQMVKEGVRFNRFYSAPNCSPTRASVLTGRHPFRSGVFNPEWVINPHELTIAEVLKRAGYATAHFGKWHLGPVASESPVNPHSLGFEYYLSHDQHFNLDPKLIQNGEQKAFDGDGSEVIVAEAVRYIDRIRESGKPFFIVIWYGSPHGGFQALPKDEALYQEVKDKLLRGYLAEITAMDRSVGTLRQKLKNRNLDQNTLVWFCSDNGNGKFEQRDKLRGGKGSIWEGGVRVPAVAVWPKMIEEPFETNAYATTWDIMPTLMDIVGVDVKNRELDGISILPVLQGKETERSKPLLFWFYARAIVSKIAAEHDPLFSADELGGASGWKSLKTPSVVPQTHPGWTTIIEGKWKLHQIAGSRKGPETLLYDIHADPGETNNLALENPEVVQSLNEKLGRWQNSVVASLKGKDYQVKPEIVFEDREKQNQP